MYSGQVYPADWNLAALYAVGIPITWTHLFSTSFSEYTAHRFEGVGMGAATLPALGGRGFDCNSLFSPGQCQTVLFVIDYDPATVCAEARYFPLDLRKFRTNLHEQEAVFPVGTTVVPTEIYVDTTHVANWKIRLRVSCLP